MLKESGAGKQARAFMIIKSNDLRVTASANSQFRGQDNKGLCRITSAEANNYEEDLN